jgi:hypothetical protein
MTKKRKTNGQSTAPNDSERVAVFLKLTVDEWTRFATVTKHMGWPTIQDALRALVAAEISRSKLDSAVLKLGHRVDSIRKSTGGLKDAQVTVVGWLLQNASPWNQTQSHQSHPLARGGEK